MTGFARVQGAADGITWTCEVKSVNSRNLDTRFRLPPGFEAIELKLRSLAQDAFARGNVSINLTVNRSGAPPQIRINRDMLDQFVALVRDYRGGIDAAQIPVETLLGLKGVTETVEEEETDEIRASREAAVVKTFEKAFAALTRSRHEEGARLAQMLREHMAEIRALHAAGLASAGAQPEQIKARLHERIAELLGGDKPVADERLAQEVALLTTKADVREEFDRLMAHIEATEELLAAGGAIGRRLDFLCQELNREANTICSKSADLGLTRVGLDLKATIERFREQVQNVE